MTQRARIAIIVIAVLGLVAAFVAASGSGKDDSKSASAPATQPAPAQTEPAAGTDTTPAATTTAPAAAPEPAAPLVRIAGGKPVGGVKKLEFKSGDQVRFRVRSDTADEIHVHGYDISRELPAGKTVTLSFRAKIEGRFEVELHHAGVQIASLEVRP